MSDTERIYDLLVQYGSVHTHDLRKRGFSGNPSQRATDIEAKYGVTIERTRESRNGRPGSRFTLVGRRASALPPGSPASSASSQETLVGRSAGPAPSGDGFSGLSPEPDPVATPGFSVASSQETVLSLDDARRMAPSAYDPYSDAA